MKRLGHTLGGNVLLECTSEEYSKLTMLAEIAADSPRPEHFDINKIDLTETFSSIMIWMLAREKANQLRAIAREIDDMLKVKDNAPSDSHAGDPAPALAVAGPLTN